MVAAGEACADGMGTPGLSLPGKRPRARATPAALCIASLLTAALVALPASPSLADGGQSSIAQWGNFGAAAPCLRALGAAARRCSDAAVAANRACFDAALTAGACDRDATQAALGAARTGAGEAVAAACTAQTAATLGAVDVSELMRDTVRACRALERATIDAAYAPLLETAPAGTASDSEAACVLATGRAAAKLSASAATTWQRTFDHIAAHALEAAAKDALVAGAAARVHRARRAVHRLIAARCPAPAFARLYRQPAPALLAAVAQAGSCFAEQIYRQPAVTCAPAAAVGVAGAACSDGTAAGYPCQNVDLLAFMPFSAIGGGQGNDVWGWTDSATGREYALMGRTNGTSFVDVTVPTAPVYLGNLPTHTANSTWRGFKVYGDHALVVSEAAGHGMQVFDLRQLRDLAGGARTFSETAHYNGFSNCHTLAVNAETGFAYAAGTNTCGGGLHVIDVRTPTTPTFAGCVSGDGYTHETQCVIYQGPDAAHRGREICFSSNTDTLTIIDVTDKALPVQLSRTGYAGLGYAHQGWLTDDHQYFLMNDELDELNFAHNTRTVIWDVRNLDAPSVRGSYFGLTTATDHNLYLANGYAFESNYRAGLRILDLAAVASGALNEVAFFDVFPASDAAGYAGTWSNYPFFASGTVLISGIESGLFLVHPSLGGIDPSPTPTSTRAATATGTATRTATATRTPTLRPADAAFVGQNIPAVMIAGQSYTVSVTMRNTGGTTWTAGQSYRLGAQNPHDNFIWGMNRVALASTDAIGPGQQKTFTWTVIAPLLPGTHNFQWRMVQDGVAWFGQRSVDAAVAVQAASSLDAAFVGQNIPAVMTAGQSYTVSVTLRNAGGTTWTAEQSYRLGAQNPHDNFIWGMNRVALASTDAIGPGQQKTFSWTVTAPLLAGTYDCAWRMVQDGVAWFGQSSPAVPVSVSP